MNIQSVMTANPASCRPSTSLHDVAQLMVKYDCGEIPVVDDDDMPVGVITDRDITVRTVAQGINPLLLTAGACMTSPCVTTTLDRSLESCCELMEVLQVRRIPVVDKRGRLCGIVSLADVAEHADQSMAVDVLKEVSEPDIDQAFPEIDDEPIGSLRAADELTWGDTPHQLGAPVMRAVAGGGRR